MSDKWLPKKRTSKQSAKDRATKLLSIVLRDGLDCHICGQPFTQQDRPTLSHLRPRAAGGTEALDNVKAAHGRCNNGLSNPPLGRRRTKDDGVVVVES